MTSRLWKHDLKLARQHAWLIGVDEAGRGAFAGPVVAGAVAVRAELFQDRRCRRVCQKINDSKQLTPEAREALYDCIGDLCERGWLWVAQGSGTVEEIEAHNILGATRLAMTRAVQSLETANEGQWHLMPADFDPAQPTLFPLDPVRADAPRAHLLLDGLRMRDLPWAHRALTGGDGRSLVIAMASILAKVSRDREMTRLCPEHPAYGFSQHKGYGTPAHREAILEHGPCTLHRRAFLSKLMEARAERAIEPLFALDE